MPRLLALLTLTALSLLTAAAPALAANPWLERRVLNMTHQGGEDEHPSGTMYAMRESLALGADMLELDVQPTKDGHLMILHDQSVERTTGETRSVYDLTLKQVRKLDAAYNFVPGKGTEIGKQATSYPLRGVRTGKKAPPLGYTKEDFRVPTLEEILRAFPDVPMNIEIKGRKDSDTQSYLDNADRLAALLKRVKHPPLVVVSFNQDAVDRFHTKLPDVAIAPGISGTADFVLQNKLPAASEAFQVPPMFQGVTIMTPDFVKRAHAANNAVHVWFSGQEESPRVYRAMLDMGVDGLMPAKPAALEKVLCARKTPRPAGNPNHCGGGKKLAAKRCRAEVTSAARVDAKGRTMLTLRRTGRDDYACGGTVRLRSLASSRFLMPWGVDRVQVPVRLNARGRAALRRDGRLRAVGETRTDGSSHWTVRRVVARGAFSLRRGERR